MWKNKLKTSLKRNKYLTFFYEFIVLLKNSNISRINGRKKHYPIVIQLPLTNKCNSNCIMCGIPNMDSRNELSIDEFRRIIRDPIFKYVKSVGINGGEPFLIPNLENFVIELLKLPKIQSLNIITNGFLTNIILSKLRIIYSLCKKRKIYFTVSISLDGYKNIHDEIRRVKGAFLTTINTIDKMEEDKKKYCDDYDVACTVSKINVNNLIELEEFAKIKNYKIKYRLAVKNKRIGSDVLTKDYSVLEIPELKQAAKEFFMRQYIFSKSLFEKYKYFSIYYFLNTKIPHRLLGCVWQNRGITLDPKGKIYYCAVESKVIGDLREHSGIKTFFNKDNLEYRNNILKSKCSNCIHDYNGELEVKNLRIFVKFLIKERYWLYIYKIKRLFL